MYLPGYFEDFFDSCIMKNDTRILFNDSYLINSYYIDIFQAKMYLFRPSDLAQSESIDFFFQPNHKTEIPPPEFNQLKRTKAKISDVDQNQDKSDLLSESSVLSRNIV